VEKRAELVVVAVGHLERRLGRAAEVVNVRHDMQQRFGAQALWRVDERDDAGLELGTFQHQAPDEIGTTIAEEAGPQHLDGA